MEHETYGTLDSPDDTVLDASRPPHRTSSPLCSVLAGLPRSHPRDETLSLPIHHRNIVGGAMHARKEAAAVAAVARALKKQKELQREWIVFHVGLVFFAVCLGLALAGHSMDTLLDAAMWPTLVVGLAFPLLLVAAAHLWQGEPQQLQGYASVILLAFVARAIGASPAMAKYGLAAPFWAIVLGYVFTQLLRLPALTLPRIRAVLLQVCHNNELVDQSEAAGWEATLLPKPLLLNQEFFIKVGVLLLATDMTSIAELGPRGLVIAWVDTVLLLTLFTLVGAMLFRFEWRHSIVVVGATCICGSSAATAIATAVDVPTDGELVQCILAIMGVLNAPLIPTMPFLNAEAHVLGAWIGGSIDSTGQVVAAASIADQRQPGALLTATIVKMSQNLLIIPVSLVLTSVHSALLRRDERAQPLLPPSSDEIASQMQEAQRTCAQRATAFVKHIGREIVAKFPRFILGFILTSAVCSCLPGEYKTMALHNSFVLSEWISLVGFVLIGVELDLSKLSNAKNLAVLGLYVLTQATDLATTFGWATLVMSGAAPTAGPAVPSTNYTGPH